MLSNDEIRSLYNKYGNKNYPVDQYCIGCNNCQEYSFPCLNCAHYVFDFKLGCGYPESATPDIETPLDMFKYIHYDEEEIRALIPKEPVCPGAPIKKKPIRTRSLRTGPVKQLTF